jgi:hypothetical protein
MIAAALGWTCCAGCGSGSATATTAEPPPPPATTPAETASESNNSPDATGNSQQRPKLLPGAKTKVLAAAGDKPYDKTFDDIRFEMKIDEPFRPEMLTDSIKSMFGQRIRIRGYMLPTAQSNGIREFVLVRDNQECCFGPGAALYDCILVQMQPGETAHYSTYPVAIEGTFGFNEIKMPDGRHLAIYRLEAESVR